jgi:hypothetical protein
MFLTDSPDGLSVLTELRLRVEAPTGRDLARPGTPKISKNNSSFLLQNFNKN